MKAAADFSLIPPDPALSSLAHNDLESQLERIAAATGEQFARLNYLIATAESCTGGMIARALTDTSGSSAWFDSGLITYSNEAKQRLLKVPAQLLQTHGAVSEAVARAMVAGALNASSASLAMSVTGVAGPGGGSAEKPVGTVWFGWGGPDAQGQTQVFSQRVNFDGGRATVRLLTAIHALSQLAHIWGENDGQQHPGHLT